MMEKILFCADFSENADRAFDLVLRLASGRPGEVEIVIFHVVPEPDAQFWKTYLYEVDGVDLKAKEAIDAKVAAAYLSKLPAGQAYRIRMAVGGVYQKIMEAIVEEKADLVVVGRQESSGIARIFFGNIVQRLALKSPCPVLIVPGA